MYMDVGENVPSALCENREFYVFPHNTKNACGWLHADQSLIKI